MYMYLHVANNMVVNSIANNMVANSMANSIANNMVALLLPLNSFVTVNVHIIIFVGAKHNIQNENGFAPLKVAKKCLADTPYEEEKQHYQQVCECAYHTITFIIHSLVKRKFVYYFDICMSKVNFSDIQCNKPACRI